MFLTINKEIIDLPPGGEVILHYQTWENYEELLAIRQDKTFPKIRYNATTQEIRLMTPLPEHGNRSDTLSDLVKLLLRHQERDWHGFDPITLKKFKQAGLEPDFCCYLQNREAILGKTRINLETDPPPDLAIEIDLTSSTKPEDYLPLAIPELWIYRQRKLLIYLFDGQKYQESDESLIFKGINVKELFPKYVERSWQAGSSVAWREFEEELTKSDKSSFSN